MTSEKQELTNSIDIMFTSDNQTSSRVEYKFIVVYDKFTKPVANSIKNQAIDLSISSTAWSEKQYLSQEPSLSNDNYVLFLSKSLLKENLSNPQLQLNELTNGTKYKTQGNVAGIFVEKVDFVEIAKQLSAGLNEKWLFVVGSLICTTTPDQLLVAWQYMSKKKKAELYLLYKATDKFAKDNLKSFVAGRLK
jgi:hypothetical protein